MFRFKVQRIAKSIHIFAGISVPIAKFPCIQVMSFVSSSVNKTGGVQKIPDNFYDEELEIEKEFEDIRTSLLEGGIDKLTVSKHTNTRRGRREHSAASLDTEDSDSDLEADIKEFYSKSTNPSSDADKEDIYMTVEQEEAEEDEKYSQFPDPILHSFIPATSSERYLGNEQGLRACPGKLQRRGKFPKLECHLIDLDELTYLDVVTLKEFMSDDGEILPKTATGLCSKCQRKVAKTIKTARNFALLPHIGTFELKDNKPQLLETLILHDASPPGAPRVVSETVVF